MFFCTLISFPILIAGSATYIHSKTPAEIAVSVMAEILDVKNGVVQPPGSRVEHIKQQLEMQTHE